MVLASGACRMRSCMAPCSSQPHSIAWLFVGLVDARTGVDCLSRQDRRQLANPGPNLANGLAILGFFQVWNVADPQSGVPLDRHAALPGLPTSLRAKPEGGNTRTSVCSEGSAVPPHL